MFLNGTVSSDYTPNFRLKITHLGPWLRSYLHFLIWRRFRRDIRIESSLTWRSKKLAPDNHKKNLTIEDQHSNISVHPYTFYLWYSLANQPKIMAYVVKNWPRGVMDPKRQKVKILKKYLKKSSWYIWKNPSQSSKKYRYLKSWDLIVTITGENFHKLLHLKWQCHKMVPLKCEKIIQKFTVRLSVSL